MIIAYIFMISCACILIAMSIESILKSTSVLNIASALLLFTVSLIAGSMGLKEIFLIGNSRLFTIVMLRVQYASEYFLGFTFLFFAANFPRDKKSARMDRYLAVFFILSLAAAITGAAGIDINKYTFFVNERFSKQRFLEIFPEFNFFHYALLIFSTSLSICSLGIIALKYRKLKLIYQKKQVRYFFSGVVFFVIVYSLAELSFIGHYPVIAFFLKGSAFTAAGGSLLYSVISYRFVNLRKRLSLLFQELLIGYFLTFILSALIFVFRTWVSIIQPIVYFIVIPPVLIIFFYLYNVSGVLIKKLFRIRYRDRDMTEIFLDRIGPSHNIQELAKKSIDILTENINCRNADFLFFDKEMDIYKVIYSSNNKSYSISAIDPFFRRITPDIDIYDREIINFDPRFSNIRDIAERYFENYETFLIIPVFYDNVITILINISGKLDNNTYTDKEMVLISKLKKIVQIVSNNIILFDKEQEAKITKRDLSLASQIQEAVFQRVIPEFISMDVFAYQKPAKEVSGDYFLIEKVDNNSMGVLIADVSGKGFSAALISMVIHTIARSQEFSSTSTNAIVARINEVMTSNQGSGRLTKNHEFRDCLLRVFRL